ncbi:glycosyltransferase family 4 protein, partial [Candidatus Micrarchaeota archaeon]|nr:glycosyltransferase family 4 protein [Candidatus Micrarchaeota archaeon]MBU1930203.1 glycosyltransferase family 4 protein [Candidatus Micrarchaeota archaeon]
KVKEFFTIHPQDSYFFSPGLVFGIRKHDADILNCQGYNNFFTLLTIIGKRSNQKLVLTLHNSGSSSKLRKMFLPFFDALIRFFGKKIDLVICTSQAEFKEFYGRLNIPKEKFCIVKRGMDVELIKSISVKKKKLLIVSVARLVEDKGMYQLIRGFSVLSKKFPDASLRIIGDGPEMNRLKQEVSNQGIEQKVDFFGMIPLWQREKYLRALKEAEVVVSLGSPYTDSLMVLEGIAAGMKVVVPTRGVLGGYVTAGQAIGVKDINNPLEVAEKLEFALKNQVKKNDPNFVLSWGQFTEQMVRIYKKLLEDRPSKTPVDSKKSV